MKHHSVKSSHLAEIGHEGTILEIRFKNGQLYRYYGVSSTVYRLVAQADSVGKAFHEHVKERYPHTLVTDP
jgi:hypothetical protein